MVWSDSKNILILGIILTIGTTGIIYSWYTQDQKKKMLFKKKNKTLRELQKKITDISKIEFPISQGIIKKLGKILGQWKTRYFILADSTLYYFDTDSNKKPTSLLGYFDILHSNFEIISNKDQRFCCKISEISQTKREYLLACDNKEDFESWFNLLSQAKNTYNSKVKLVTSLQSIVKRNMQVKNYKKLKEAALVIQNAYHFYEGQRQFARFLSRVIKVQSIVRGFIQRTKFKKFKADILTIQTYYQTFKAKARLEKEFTRKRIVQELVATEKSYVYNLKLIIDIFIRPLTNFNNIDQKVLSLSEISSVFSNWEKIHKINSALLELFQERLDKWHIDQNLGDIFISNTDSLFEYTPFVTNYEHSRKLLDRLTQNNVNFRHFLDAAQRDKRSKYLDISSFLIQPIQRLPRYELLLRDILKITVNCHPDRENLLKGVTKIREITMYINDQQKERENLTQVLQIQQELLAFKNDKNLSFSSASRLVRQGDVKFLKKKWNYIYLFNTQIIIIEKKDESKKIKEVIQLDNVSLRDESTFNPENLSSSDILAMSPPSSPTLSASTTNISDSLSSLNLSQKENSNNSSAGKSLIGNRFKILAGKAEYTLYWDTPAEKDSWLTDITITLNRLDSQKRINLISSQ